MNIPMVLPGGASLLDLPYDPAKGSSLEQQVAVREVQASILTLAQAAQKEKDPIVEVLAMNDYVVYRRKSGERIPVSRREAVQRLYAVIDQLMCEDGGALSDQMTYDEWLIENTVNACCRSAEMVGQPYSTGMREKTLQRLRMAVKGYRNRVTGPVKSE
jgi:hypothetical protein